MVDSSVSNCGGDFDGMGMFIGFEGSGEIGGPVGDEGQSGGGELAGFGRVVSADGEDVGSPIVAT